MPRQREDDDDRPEEPRDDDSPLGPPRRRRRRRDEDYDDEDDVGEGISTIIPYKNGYALASYYCGVFSLIPCVGGLLSVIAIVLGFMGLSYVKKHPTAHGTAHAIVGLVLGFLVLLAHLAGVVIIVGLLIAAANAPHRF
jgi:Domain of unknown function (DUF4190)